jgi:enoyl-CoA hydratase/carnithine racemase
MVVREDRGTIAVLRMGHGRANALDPELLGALGAALGQAGGGPRGRPHRGRRHVLGRR